jgi:hypothetical protein
MLLPIFAHAEGNNLWEVKLPFEKATIEYTISGVEEGTETVYIRNHGDTIARYRRSAMQVMGIEKITEVIDFIDHEWIYTYDLQENTGTKKVNPKKYLDEEYDQLTDSGKKLVQRNSEELGIGLLYSGMSGEFEKNAVMIQGMSCDKIQFMGTTMYTIHDSDIALKTESDIMGMITLIEAISVKEGFAPEYYFQHPEGITAVIDPEADAIARSMAQETIRNLSDPNVAEKGLYQESTHHLQPDPEEQQDMEKAIEALKNIFEQ